MRNTLPAFVINLDRSPDRLASISACARAAGIDLERVPGVEGKTLTDRRFGRWTFNPQLTFASMGCYAGHLRCVSIIIERKLPFALVFEDDAEFESDLAQILLEAAEQAPKDWDVISLEGKIDRAVIRIATLSQGELVRFSRNACSAAGYLISQRGAQKYAAQTHRVWLPDGDIREGWQFDLNVFGINPLPVRQGGFVSTIVQHNNQGIRALTRAERWKCMRWQIRHLGVVGFLACETLNIGVRLRGRVSKILRKRRERTAGGGKRH